MILTFKGGSTMNPRNRRLRLKKSTVRELDPEHATHAAGGGPPVIKPGDSNEPGCTNTCLSCHFTQCDTCPITYCFNDSCNLSDCQFSNGGFTVCLDLCA